MPPVAGRSPGPLGAALADGRVFIEVIADGVHVSPVNLRWLFGAVPERLVLVTDAMAALDEGLARGFRRFALYGGVGGRFDHTLANVQAMAYLAGRGARGVLIGDGDALTAVRDGAIEFPAGLTGYLSVFCHGDRATGVNERGLKYSLTDATLTNRHALGVSNEFTGAPARVSVASGTLVIYWHQAAEAAVALLAAQP